MKKTHVFAAILLILIIIISCSKEAVLEPRPVSADITLKMPLAINQTSAKSNGKITVSLNNDIISERDITVVQYDSVTYKIIDIIEAPFGIIINLAFSMTVGTLNFTGSGEVMLSEGESVTANIQMGVVLTPSEFITVPAGTFNMGSNDSIGERPVHSVTLTRDFEMGRYEVTQQEWLEVMLANPSAFKGDLRRPVEQVNFYDALVYCNKRSILENRTPCYTINGFTDPAQWGKIPASSSDSLEMAVWNSVTLNSDAEGYRMATEAEWEYAARYNDARTYAWGNSVPDAGHCNFNNVLAMTSPVGTYSPLGDSQLGFCDITGNVFERVWDWSEIYDPAGGAETDPSGPAAGIAKISRGGGYYYNAWQIRAAIRPSTLPYGRSMHIGLRLARTLLP